MDAEQMGAQAGFEAEEVKKQVEDFKKYAEELMTCPPGTLPVVKLGLPHIF